MKKILFIIVMLCSVASFGQTIGYFRYDTSKFYTTKVGGRGSIDVTGAVKFTGLLPKSAGTDSVVVRDASGYLGTVAKTAFGSPGWALLGNSGTTAGTNFIGTTDAVGLMAKTNGVQRMNISSAGQFDFGLYGATTSSTKFTNQNLWSVDSARQWRLRSFRASDSSIQLIETKSFGSAGLKRIQISSQDTANLCSFLVDHDHFTFETYDRTPTLSLVTAFVQASTGWEFTSTLSPAASVLRMEETGRVGIGQALPDPSSQLDITSTTRGLLTPRMNTTQQNAISSPATGLIIWNTDTLGLVNYTGTAWLKVNQSSSGGSSLFPLTGTGTATGNVTGDLDGNDLSVNSGANFLFQVNSGTSEIIARPNADDDNSSLLYMSPTSLLSHVVISGVTETEINQNGTAGTIGYIATSGHQFTGNVGIGVAPTVALDVVGSIRGRWQARVGSTTSSGTPTINTDNVDIYKLTAQAADITDASTNLTGTPVDGDIFEIQITGTAARAITWGSAFVSSTVTLPATTVTTATLTVIFQYYTTSSYGNNKWVCVNSF